MSQVDQTFHVYQQKLATLKTDGPKLIAIAGPPGSGKSTLADELSQRFNQVQAGSCQVIPIDGWHYDNALLQELGLKGRKGSPESFDVQGLIDLFKRIKKRQHSIAVPLFDRDLDVSRDSARFIHPKTQILLVEGNYLLLNRPGWKEMHSLFDLTSMLEVPMDVLQKRLLERWANLPEDLAQQKIAANDLPNARLVIEHSRPADFTISLPAS